MLTLSMAIVALFAAPLIFSVLPHKDPVLRFIDGFIFVAIGGMILLGILPETYQSGGWPVFAFLIAGMMLPTVSERLLHSVKGPHGMALILGVLGIFLHAITDGAALSGASYHEGHDHDHDHNHYIALSVVLHRIPISLMVWWFVKPQMGKIAAYALLGLIGVGTLLGYGASAMMLDSLNSYGIAWFQAFVVGSLIHVILHRMHAPGSGCSHEKGTNWWEGVGNVCGALLLFYIAQDHNHFGGSEWFPAAWQALVDLSMESAPALLFAYLISSVALGFLPNAYVKWMSSGSPLSQSLRGVLVGLPLPVCSCGVVPLYHTLIRRGAPPTAAMAFLIATPELGLDALLLSVPLLGGSMTVVRVIAAAIVALLVGYLVGRVAKVHATVAPPSCCDGKPVAEPKWQTKLGKGLKEGFGDLVDHTAPWIIVGLLVAAALFPLFDAQTFAWLPKGLEVPFFAILGMPIYVCASGATPLVAVFLMGGVSPGAALAFLITGPATNITTFGVLRQLHGKATVALFTVTTFVITVALGYLTNLALPHFTPVALQDLHEHQTWFHFVALLLMLAIYGYSLLRRGTRAFVGELFTTPHHHNEPDVQHKEAHTHAH